MITIIGAGRVGSSAAFRITGMELDDVLLVDIVEGLPRGEALDISQSCDFDVKLTGTNDFKDMSGSDLVINAAGLARKPGMTRLDLMNKNAGITRSVAEKIKKYAPGAVVIQVANPMDMMALVQLKTTGFPRERVIGMGGMLDSLRFSYFISQHFGISPKKVESLVMGEHGDSMVPLASQARVDGKPLQEAAKKEDIEKILDLTRKAGAEVIGLKGATVFAPARAIAIMAEAVIKDKKKVIPTAVYLQGEYGVSGIYTGVPARIGKAGLLEVLELDIDEGERKAFLDSCNVLRGKVKELGLL
jgi:malate dehydrogenase